MNITRLDTPVEIVERRSDRWTKHYLVGHDETGQEVYEAYRFPVPVHYESDGEWLDIAPAWVDGTLIGVPYEATLGGIGCEHIRLLDHEGIPHFREHRVWWHAIARDTSAVLTPSYRGVQLHLILWGPHAPREWRFWHADSQRIEIGGRDNIEGYTLREGREQHYELEIETERDGPVITKRWTGRVKALDPVTRRKYWSSDAAYPVRVI